MKNSYKYSNEELNLLFKKYYKQHLKKITYFTLTNSDIEVAPFHKRIKLLINEYKNNNEKYDLYIFIRIDCAFLKKLNLYNYSYKLDSNMVKFICHDIVRPNRLDHNRDWDMGIISKNIENINKYVLQDFKKLTPDDYELKKMAKIIKCNNIFTKYNLPLSSEIEKIYKKSWQYLHNCEIYSFNKLISPLWYENDFYLSIIR